MAIFTASKNVTEGSPALALFTDRYEACERFIRALNVDPPPTQIFFFHGDGGNGKSLLLYFLHEKCGMRLSGPDWGRLNQKAGRELVEAFHTRCEDGDVMPWGYLDFGMPPRGENRPQEAFSALLMLRRQLSAFDFRFPLYDFAVLWYLHRTNQLTDAREYLQKAQVEDVPLQEALIGYTSVSEGQIHPLFLGLTVDILRAAEAKGQTLSAADFVSQADTRQKERELVHRLLRYVNDEMGYAIHALAACRAFNYPVYRHLGQALGFPTSRPIFDRLTRFSFVWAAEALPSPQASPPSIPLNTILGGKTAIGGAFMTCCVVFLPNMIPLAKLTLF